MVGGKQQRRRPGAPPVSLSIAFLRLPRGTPPLLHHREPPGAREEEVSPMGSEGPNPDRKSSDGYLEKATVSLGVRIQMARMLHPPPDMAYRGMARREEEPCR